MAPVLSLALLLALGAAPAATAAAPRAEGAAAGGAARELGEGGEAAAAEEAPICDVGGSASLGRVHFSSSSSSSSSTSSGGEKIHAPNRKMHGERTSKRWRGGGGLLLPVLPGENSWNKPARAILYFVGISWCFVGVSIVADIFMAAIEAITEKRKTVELSNGRTVVVKAWNDTVANLSLMALGSSAPEILLSCIEIVGNKFYSGALGPSTIVGSAAFNLLVIIAVCICVIPNGETRTIKKPAVFVVTAVASTFAYVWLVFIVGISSPDVVEPWEGVFTFAFFPILVVIAFLADKGKLGFLARNGSPQALSKSCAGISKSCSSLGELKDDEVKLVEDQALAVNSRASTRKGAGKIGCDDLPPSDLSVGFTTPEVCFSAGAEALVLELEKTGLKTNKYFVEVSWEDSNGQKGSTTIHKNDTQGKITIRSSKTGGERLTVNLTRAFASYTAGLRGKACTIMPDSAKAQVSVADDDGKKSGIGQLQMAVVVLYHQPTTDSETQCWVKVCRLEGSEGAVECRLFTIADTARPSDGVAAGGGDYQHLDCRVVLESGVMEKSVAITIQKRSGYESSDRFFVELEGDHVAEGAGSSRCAVNILPASEVTDTAMRVSRWMDHAFNFDALNEGTSNWADQFRDAIWPVPDDEHDEVTAAEWCMHLVALPWKVLFAFIPPVVYGGGWVCFCVALAFIGCVTAVIGDLASLLGCCLGMPDSITAITIVALGTSLPDLFASKVSAVEDPSADNAIGNVTGSNAVNVFLGLGLPWMMAAFYWTGNADSAWKLKYPEAPHIYEAFPNGAFVVVAGDLVFSVIVFLMCTVIALMTIRYRRNAHDAELGGPAGIKVNSAILFVLLWFVYVSCASWKTLAGDVGAEAMVLAVLCNFAGAGFLMVLIVVSVHIYDGRAKRSEERNQEAQATWIQTVMDEIQRRNTMMDEFRRASSGADLGAPAAAAGAHGAGIAALAESMRHHVSALAEICEELGRAADGGGSRRGPKDEGDDAEEGSAGPAVEAAEGRGKRRVAKASGRRSAVTFDSSGQPSSQSSTKGVDARAAARSSVRRELTE